MTQEEIGLYSQKNNQNDLSIIEPIVFSIFSKTDKKYANYRKKIRSLLLKAMRNVKVNLLRRNVFWLYVKRTIMKGIQRGLSLSEIEKNLRRFLRRHADDEKDLKVNAYNRARRGFDKIKDYIEGNRILDLGAGNGLIGEKIKNELNREVFLIDVVDYNISELPMIIYNPDGKIPLNDKEVDTTILYAVLHHTNNPEYILKEAARVTKKRLIIKEASAETETVRMINSFFDWFYNRVIGDEDINIPLNFRKVKEWRLLLNQYGFDVANIEDVGIDEPIVPEHHIFLIADKIR